MVSLMLKGEMRLRWARWRNVLGVCALSFYFLPPAFAAGPPAIILVQPETQTVSQNDRVTFYVVATSGTSLSYQWQKNGSSISGATLSSYTISNAQGSDQGTYVVKVTNGGGTVNSSNAVLTVRLPPTITNPPLSQTNAVGASASFSVGVSGADPFYYQWRYNGVPLAGATNGTLLINNLQTNHAGGYSVVISNDLGSATSTEATLTVLIPPTIVTQPTNQAATVGQSASFTVVAAGSPPFSYQWYLNGSSLGILSPKRDLYQEQCRDGRRG